MHLSFCVDLLTLCLHLSCSHHTILHKNTNYICTIMVVMCTVACILSCTLLANSLRQMQPRQLQLHRMCDVTYIPAPAVPSCYVIAIPMT